MAKKGGTKRKIPMAKIEKKTSRGPCYSKRCKGLFSKASQLCLLSGAQIAVLATPLSDNSNVSFYSFGHSSVDAVVSAFLSGNRPLVPTENNKRMREDIGVCFTRKDLGLGYWWEDETLTGSQNPQELSEAVDSIKNLLKDVKKLNTSDYLDLHQELDQTLSTVPDFFRSSDDFLHNNDTQIMPFSEDFSNAENKNALSDDIDMDFETTSESLLPYPGLLETSFESLLSNGDFQSTQELHEFAANLFKTSDSLFSDSQLVKDVGSVFHDFAASPLTSSDSHDSIDPTMFSEPVKDGDLVFQEFAHCSMDPAMFSEPVKDRDLLPQKFAHGSMDPSMFYDSEPVKDGYFVRHEFPASLPASCDSHDSMDPTVFFDFEPVKDVDLVLQNFAHDSIDSTMFSDSKPVEDGDLVLQEFAASLLAGFDSHDSTDPSMFYDYQPIKDGDLVLQNKGFNDDDLHFSDFFSELPTIATL